MDSLKNDPVAMREKIFSMQQEVESLEKRIARVTKAAKQLQKAHAVLAGAASEFHQSMLPFATAGKGGDNMIAEYSRILEKVNESDGNLGDRLGPMVVDPLNRFLDNEVRVGLDLHARMVKAREAYDTKVARTKKKDGKAVEEIEEKKREFEEANARYVQKLIDVETKTDFELMDVFTTWMVCSLTHHKRCYKMLDELQPKIKQYKKKMLQDSKAYNADEEVRTTIVKESLAKKGSQSEIQGYLTNQSVIGKPRRFWAVANGMLAQYRNYADFSPIESYDLLLFTVKPVPDDASAFCLVSPSENMVLQAGSPEERAEWMTAIAASISNQLNAQSSTLSESGRLSTTDPAHPLQRIRRGNESFRRCADCGAPDPDWGAINLGILFCIHCSGIHRNLGVHVSQVRSLTLDVEVWDDDLMRMMTGVGNETSNSVWEANYRDVPPRPSPGCDMKAREAFILAKYKDRSFVDVLEGDVDEALLELCAVGNETPSVRDLLHFYASGARLDATDDLGQTALHLLVQHADSLVLLEFLCRNGVPASAADKSGATALQLAQRIGASKTASCLRRHAGGGSGLRSPHPTAPRVRPGGGGVLSRSSNPDVGSPSASPGAGGGAPEEARRQRTWTSTKPREAAVVHVWQPARPPSGLSPVVDPPDGGGGAAGGATSPRLRTLAVPSVAVQPSGPPQTPKKPLPQAPRSPPMSHGELSPPPPLPADRVPHSPGRAGGSKPLSKSSHIN